MAEAPATAVAPYGSVPQDVVVRIPSREAAVFRRINSTCTGDISSTGTMLTVWDPAEGQRYILRGGRLSAVITTKGTTTGVNTLMLVDDGTTLSEDCIVTLGHFASDSPVGQIICQHLAFDLNEGIPGSARDAVLRIAANSTIGSAVIRVTGVLWGTEVSQ